MSVWFWWKDEMRNKKVRKRQQTEMEFEKRVDKKRE